MNIGYCGRVNIKLNIKLSLASASTQAGHKTAINYNKIINNTPKQMDAQLEQAVNEIMSQEGVTGVLFVDQHGLCLTARGDATSTASGFISAIVSRAADIGGDDCTMCIETDDRNIFLKRQDDMTVAVFKKSAAIAQQ